MLYDTNADSNIEMTVEDAGLNDIVVLLFILFF